MPTKIYVANVIIGNASNPTIIEKVPVLKIPIHLLMADKKFTNKLINWCGGVTEYNQLPLNKKTGFPPVKVVYLKFISNINQEPLIGETL